MKVLIDTSIWITFFRATNKNVIAEVARLLERGQVVVAGAILVEIFQGALNEKELKKIKSLLEPVERIDPLQQDWEKAGRLSFQVRKKGTTVSTIDILLATLAIENNCAIYSEDRHFEAIAKHSELVLHAPEIHP